MESKKSYKEAKKHSKKHKRVRTEGSSDSESSNISIDEELKLKLLKKLKKIKKKKKIKKIRERERKSKEEDRSVKKNNAAEVNKECKTFAPMTKEEWEKQQNTLRRVYDKETGRTRLIRGSGEIVEECVSRERQLAINKQATLKDGEYFQKMLSMKMK